MNSPAKRIALFFCVDETTDHVAPRALSELDRVLKLEEGDVGLDGHRRLVGHDSAGNELVCIRTDHVLSRAYNRYLPFLSAMDDFDWAVIVNWHEGMNAPDRIFTVHTTGDVATGTYPPADPALVRALLNGLEAARKRHGLDDFQVLTEGTHWSGVQFGSPAELCAGCSVPLVDLEIGSTSAAWRDETAVVVLTEALARGFVQPLPELFNILCIGGQHIDASYIDAALWEASNAAIGISHILPNHWLVDGSYDEPSALDRLRACVDSIAGGVSGIACHAKLASPYKKQVRLLAEELGVPVLKHRALRNPETLMTLRRADTVAV